MKTFVVVGGSKGIGRAIVNLLLPNNKVINISRSQPDITHDNFKHFTADVLKDLLPNIDVAHGLIYCPGSINLKPFDRLSTEDFKEDFEINVLGAITIIQNYLPALKNSGSGSILLFSTVATKLGMPYHASVATAKSGINGLVKSLGAELAPTIRVNAIAPTVTNTQLASRLLRNDRMKESLKERHPLKDYLTPEEVAEMVDYLISDKAKSITGQIFDMDFGIVSIKS